MSKLMIDIFVNCYLSHCGHEPRIVEHPLGGGGLAGVDVSHDANIADVIGAAAVMANVEHCPFQP